VIAALFLFVELLSAQRSVVGDRLQPAPAVREPILLGVLMLFGAASAAGLPPLPGFLGKLMILESSVDLASSAWVWTVVLAVGFLTIVGLARAGVIVFWHVQADLPANPSGTSLKLLAAPMVLMGVTLALAVWAGPIKRYTDETAAQLSQKQDYYDAVLRRQGGTDLKTTVPYTGFQAPVNRTQAVTPAEVQQ
jgi:multicomponent K+:H+ antiporter subunit D